MNDAILLADADLWIKVIGGIIVALIYLVNHIFGAAGKAPQRRQGRPEPRPDARAARPRPAVAGGRQDTQDEVAEFLKRAAEKRSAARSPEPRAAQDKVDPRIAEMRAAAQQRRPVVRPANQPAAEIVEARAVEELPSNRWPSPMQPQVGNRDLTERAGHLAHADRGDAAFQAHMQLFDHQVGRISESPVKPPPGEVQDAGPQTINAPPNEVFAALLSDPQSLRQAIILNEIIERPVERW